MDPTTLPHVHSAADLADDREAARRRDNDNRRAQERDNTQEKSDV